MVMGLGHLPYKDRVRKFGLFSPKRRLHGNLTANFQCLKEI